MDQKESPAQSGPKLTAVPRLEWLRRQVDQGLPMVVAVRFWGRLQRARRLPESRRLAAVLKVAERMADHLPAGAL
jgi:hypothetical protein